MRTNPKLQAATVRSSFGRRYEKARQVDLGAILDQVNRNGSGQIISAKATVQGAPGTPVAVPPNLTSLAPGQVIAVENLGSIAAPLWNMRGAGAVGGVENPRIYEFSEGYALANGASYDSGDMLIFSDAPGSPNFFFDESEGALYGRLGTVNTLGFEATKGSAFFGERSGAHVLITGGQVHLRTGLTGPSAIVLDGITGNASVLGTLSAGGGNTRLNQSGMSLIGSITGIYYASRSITWYSEDGATRIGNISGYRAPMSVSMTMNARAQESYQDALAQMQTYNVASTNSAILGVSAPAIETGELMYLRYNGFTKLYVTNTETVVNDDLIVNGDTRLDGPLTAWRDGAIRTGAIFVPLAARLSSTDWDGDARSTTAKTLIDLSAVFGVPANAKAVLVHLAARDSGSAGTPTRVLLSPENADGIGALFARMEGLANDSLADDTGIVPCDTNGDIYYQVVASGSGTMDVWLYIWGYWV